MRTALQEHGPLSRGAFAVAVLVSFAVLFAPADDVPSAPPGVDKLIHGLVFAVLAVTGRWAGFSRVVLVPVLVLYAPVSEILQGMIGRDAAVGDWVADMVGLLLGLLGWKWLGRHDARQRDRLA